MQNFLNKFATKKVVTIMAIVAGVAILVSVLGFTGVLDSIASSIASGG